MKTKDEYLIEAKKNLLKVGERCIITHVKSVDFYKQGIVLSHFHYCGTFFWDYLIKLDDGKIIYKDKCFVDSVS
jgi:DUF971 family protein